MESFLDDLKRPQPDPGGGAAAAHGALLGMALLEKILLIERKRMSAREGDEHLNCIWESSLQKALELQAAFVRLREEDVKAYHELAEAIRALARAERLHVVVERAICCPLRIMECSREALAIVEAAGLSCRRHLVADVLVACEMLGAALAGASHIAVANLPLIRSAAVRAKWLSDLNGELARGKEVMAHVRGVLEQRNAAGSR